MVILVSWGYISKKFYWGNEVIFCVKKEIVKYTLS